MRHIPDAVFFSDAKTSLSMGLPEGDHIVALYAKRSTELTWTALNESADAYDICSDEVAGLDFATFIVDGMERLLS